MRLRDILTFQDPVFAESFTAAISAVESVHQFPVLPNCPVMQSRKRIEQGAYYFRDRPNSPLRIEVSRYANYPNLTLIHEVGHLLDTLVLNSFKSSYGSECDPRFDALQVEWRSSLQGIPRLLNSPRATSTDRHHLRTLMRPRELWARTYTQWVVTRSSNEELQAQLEAVRVQGTFLAHQRVILQWEDEAFKGIMVRVDKLMNEVCLP